MKIALKLCLFREFHHWQPEDVASRLSISINDYKELEKGSLKPNGAIAQQLADLYQAPIELFIIDDTPYYYQADVLFTNCHFNGNGANGYINHQYNDRGMEEALAAKNSEIKTLKLLVESLHQQNIKLLELVGK